MAGIDSHQVLVHNTQSDKIIASHKGMQVSLFFSGRQCPRCSLSSRKQLMRDRILFLFASSPHLYLFSLSHCLPSKNEPLKKRKNINSNPQKKNNIQEKDEVKEKPSKQEATSQYSTIKDLIYEERMPLLRGKGVRSEQVFSTDPRRSSPRLPSPLPPPPPASAVAAVAAAAAPLNHHQSQFFTTATTTNAMTPEFVFQDDEVMRGKNRVKTFSEQSMLRSRSGKKK